jgi:hypothetical protein
VDITPWRIFRDFYEIFLRTFPLRRNYCPGYEAKLTVAVRMSKRDVPSLMLARTSGNNLRANMSGKSDTGDEKRRTVTTIETHEVWIVRRILPGVADEAQTLGPLEIPQTAASPLSENNHSEETKQEDKS